MKYDAVGTIVFHLIVLVSIRVVKSSAETSCIRARICIDELVNNRSK